MPFRDGSTFYFLGGILDHNSTWALGIVLRCPSYMFLFQLTTFPSPSDSEQLRAPRVWQVGSLHLLYSAENKTWKFFASCGAVGRIHVGQSFKVSSYCLWIVFVRDTSIGGSQQDWEFLFEKGVPMRRP